MKRSNKPLGIVVMTLALAAAGLGQGALAQQPEMTFFITSAGPGDGANLGGLEGADAHCARLAAAAGSTLTNWKAYLSVTAKVDRSGGSAKVIPGVNARDRIGSGPWHNAKGVLIARDVAHLHSADNPIDKQTGLDESGKVVNPRGRRHDLQRLDQQRPGLGHRRPPRPRRALHGLAHAVVELRARLRRLQPGRAQENRRRRAVLLLRRALMAPGSPALGHSP